MREDHANGGLRDKEGRVGAQPPRALPGGGTRIEGVAAVWRVATQPAGIEEKRAVVGGYIPAAWMTILLRAHTHKHTHTLFRRCLT